METELFKLTLAFRGLSDDPDGDVEDLDLGDEELDKDDDDEENLDAPSPASDEGDDDDTKTPEE